MIRHCVDCTCKTSYVILPETVACARWVHGEWRMFNCRVFCFRLCSSSSILLWEIQTICEYFRHQRESIKCNMTVVCRVKISFYYTTVQMEYSVFSVGCIEFIYSGNICQKTMLVFLSKKNNASQSLIFQRHVFLCVRDRFLLQLHPKRKQNHILWWNDDSLIYWVTGHCSSSIRSSADSKLQTQANVPDFVTSY